VQHDPADEGDDGKYDGERRGGETEKSATGLMALVSFCPSLGTRAGDLFAS